MFLRPFPELVKVSDAKVGPVYASSLSQAMHSLERAQLKLRAGARSSLVLQAMEYRASCKPRIGKEAGYSTPSSGQIWSCPN